MSLHAASLWSVMLGLMELTGARTLPSCSLGRAALRRPVQWLGNWQCPVIRDSQMRQLLLRLGLIFLMSKQCPPSIADTAQACPNQKTKVAGRSSCLVFGRKIISPVGPLNL
ncbi:hypothetical protein QBC33DRAFT_297356 [Phialemonium atrogriseum]|uniref:Secreted protein n=1 Tax=Phialemonium atrogriseum TaxID=1093897 RepID=A0AAJ0C4J7_9PEZI|nr:uncharacterized protein QBC33DRAFT_297356 [Phialemonium atrogriseum]KAK1769786.1 hypothetical protein QBC33DRAFT_297356 [Phialemonium atrogriseum]